ncbi:MAG TPA: hypothetical protein VHQ45_07790 [Gemmatimonadaceae bacterium]|nr:hypothetical protein [Gemmatimonadaceae bacterium]
MALVVTLVAVTILGVLCTAALAASVQASRDQTRERAERAAFDLAEAALTSALHPARRASLLALAPGGRLALDTNLVAPIGYLRARTTAVRFSSQVLWLEADAEVRSAPADPPIARRRTALLVAARVPPLPPDAALVGVGAVALAGSARVDGTEAAAAVGCPSDPPSTPGTGALLAGGSLTLADAAAVDGVPPVAHDTLAAGALADSLARWVDALLAATPPALLADSLGAATPVVRVTGSLVAPHGSAAGVLVVDGDLTLDGDFTHEGVVVVRGAVTAGGAGVELRGTLIALGAGPHAIAGNVRVLRSRCAARRALAALTMLEPLRERAWGEVW